MNPDIRTAASTSNPSKAPEPTASLEPLKGSIEAFLEGPLQAPSANVFAEQFLIERACRPELATAARELCALLEHGGYQASVRYCKSDFYGHPIPIVAAQDARGEYALPNINAVWNPVPLEERGGSADSSKKRVIAPDNTDELGAPQNFALRVERFAPAEPVCLAILPSDTPDAPAKAVPILSPAAFLTALQHAAASIRAGDNASPSFVRDEVIAPWLRDEIRRYSPLFGEREVPEIVDLGTTEDGKVFRVLTYIPKANDTKSLRKTFSVRMSNGECLCG